MLANVEDIESLNGDLVTYFQQVLDSMNTKERAEVSLRYLDVSTILTQLKAFDFFFKTVESQMKIDLDRMRADRLVNEIPLEEENEESGCSWCGNHFTVRNGLCYRCSEEARLHPQNSNWHDD